MNPLGEVLHLAQVFQQKAFKLLCDPHLQSRALSVQSLQTDVSEECFEVTPSRAHDENAAGAIKIIRIVTYYKKQTFKQNQISM